MRKNYIAIAIAIATTAMLSGTSIAHNLPGSPTHPDTPDISGDSLINLPKHGTTVPSKSVDVWFVQIPGATGYSLDLVGGGVMGGATGELVSVCGTPTGNAGATPPEDSANRAMEMRKVLRLSDLDCGTETSETLSGDGDVRGLQLCHYKLPDLPNGSYALAINPIVVGGLLHSQQEIRNPVTCGSPVAARDSTVNVTTGVSTASAAGNDTRGYITNLLKDRTNVSLGPVTDGLGVNVVLNTAAAAANSPLSADTFYQRFAVQDATPAPTQAPSKSSADHPVMGAKLSSNANLLEWSDPSGSAGAANWYEIWIYDKDNNRIEGSAKFGNDNLSFNQWYKVVVNPALSCQSYNGQGTSRICTVDLSAVIGSGVAPLEPGITAAFAAANVNDEFNWYVRGYNDQFGLGPWSAPGMFRKD